MKNLTLDDSSIKSTNFLQSNLSGAYIGNCNLSKTIYNICNLSYANFSGTKLKGIDFSNSEIDEITCYLEDLKGAIMNEIQALEFLKIIGIKIKGN